MADKKKTEEEPKAEKPKESGRDIDQRMADLLADHKKMGAR